MFEPILAWAASNVLGITLTGGSVVGLLLSWALNKYVDKDAFGKRLDVWMLANAGYVEAVPMGLGKTLTANIAKWPFIGVAWNNIIEPYLIFFVDLFLKFAVWFVMTVINGFKKGLMSDNTNFANQTKTDAAKANKLFPEKSD